MYSLYKVTADTANADVVIELLAISREQVSLKENTTHSLTEHFHNKGFYKVTYLLTESAMGEKQLDFSTMNEEGVLRKVRLTRTGQRVDLLIHSSFSE
jgi:hypothetical protein